MCIFPFFLFLAACFTASSCVSYSSIFSFFFFTVSFSFSFNYSPLLVCRFLCICCILCILCLDQIPFASFSFVLFFFSVSFSFSYSPLLVCRFLGIFHSLCMLCIMKIPYASSCAHLPAKCELFISIEFITQEGCMFYALKFGPQDT